jgi:CRP-like cAMP-binding protein
MSQAPVNLLLARIPEAERRTLLPMLKAVSLPLRHVLYEPEKEPPYIHFLTAGMASIVTNMEDGVVSEGGLVGQEGIPESLHLLGPGLVQTSCFMQIPGTGLRMRFRDFQEQLLHLPALRGQVLAFIQYQYFILGQVAACNRLHEVEARLARWLLMVDDRTDQEQLPLTQEFLSQMLGTRRSTVTLVAGTLQHRGIIDYSRGHVRLLDRTKLKALACECYQITDDMLQRFRGLRLEPAHAWGISTNGKGTQPGSRIVKVDSVERAKNVCVP